MLRGTRDDHVRWLLAWFAGHRLHAAVLDPDAPRRQDGTEVVEVRRRGPAAGRRLLALIALDGLEARIDWVERSHRGLAQTALARLQETFGGKP